MRLGLEDAVAETEDIQDKCLPRSNLKACHAKIHPFSIKCCGPAHEDGDFGASQEVTI